MIPFLIGIGVGVVIDKLFSSEKEESKKDKYFVFVNSEEFGKNTLTFDGFRSAKIIYDRIVSKKKVTYRDIVDFDQLEKKLYDEWSKEGNIGKEGYPKSLTQMSKVYQVAIGLENETFETKNFR
jgi:hypothetical protein